MIEPQRINETLPMLINDPIYRGRLQRAIDNYNRLRAAVDGDAQDNGNNETGLFGQTIQSGRGRAGTRSLDRSKIRRASLEGKSEKIIPEKFAGSSFRRGKVLFAGTGGSGPISLIYAKLRNRIPSSHFFQATTNENEYRSQK